MKLRPLHNQLVVAVEEVTRQSAGGIYIPGEVEKSRKALVLAVGPGKLNEKGERVPMGIEVGDTVVLHHKAGEVVKVDGEEYVIIRDTEVYAVVNA